MVTASKPLPQNEYFEVELFHNGNIFTSQLIEINKGQTSGYSHVIDGSMLSTSVKIVGVIPDQTNLYLQ